MDARQIIDYAAEDNAKDFREALYASIYDKINSHIETMKQGIAHNLVTQEEAGCATKGDAKKIAKKEVKKHEDDMHEELSEYSLEEIEEYMQTEEYSQLDEVSKETLKSYVKKASKDAGTDQLKMVRRHKKDTMKVGAPKEGPDYRNIGKQREKGISKALDKLTKEEFELNENEDLLKIISQARSSVPKEYKDVHKHIDAAEKHIKAGNQEKALHHAIKFAQLSQQYNEEVQGLDEAVTRKHFQMVADLIKSHENPAKRKELAQHHAEIFKQQNPRFDHAKFMKAAGAAE